MLLQRGPVRAAACSAWVCVWCAGACVHASPASALAPAPRPAPACVCMRALAACTLLARTHAMATCVWYICVLCVVCAVCAVCVPCVCRVCAVCVPCVCRAVPRVCRAILWLRASVRGAVAAGIGRSSDSDHTIVVGTHVAKRRHSTIKQADPVVAPHGPGILRYPVVAPHGPGILR